MARHSGSARLRVHPESVGLRLGRRIALTVLVGSVAAFAALLSFSSTGSTKLVRDLLLFNLAHVAAASLCWWPRVETARDRRAWRLLAVAVLLATGGNICFTLIPGTTLLPALTSASGPPTISDLLYLAAYPIINVAAILLVRDRGRHIVSAVWLDGLVIGLGVAAVAAAVVMAPLLRLEPPVSAGAVADLAYPVADLTLLIVLATVAGITRLRVERRLALLGLGLGVILVTDLAYLLLHLSRSYREGDPVDLGWLLALLPIAGAAYLCGPTGQPDTNRLTAPIERTAIAAPTVAALAALAVLMSGFLGDLPAAAGWLACACVLVTLLRAALTLQQLRALPEARRQARTDPLTDLANRRYLHECCARLLARPNAAPVTLLVIDLDGFKVVNDHHGHSVGDALLVEVATRFATTMRQDDLLGRLGGDEFAAVLPRTTPLQAHMVAQRMRAALVTPIVVEGRAFRIDASVGISAAGRAGMHTATLFQEADTAMYRAKKTRTGTAIAAHDRPRANRHPHRDDLARRRA